jgi:small neutral amino acid transporter SnatA (MarC family)
MIETALVAFTTFFATIGVLLAALAVQFVFDGIAASGLLA